MDQGGMLYCAVVWTWPCDSPIFSWLMVNTDSHDLKFGDPPLCCLWFHCALLIKGEREHWIYLYMYITQMCTYLCKYIYHTYIFKVCLLMKMCFTLIIIVVSLLHTRVHYHTNKQNRLQYWLHMLIAEVGGAIWSLTLLSLWCHPPTHSPLSLLALSFTSWLGFFPSCFSVIQKCI